MYIGLSESSMFPNYLILSISTLLCCVLLVHHSLLSCFQSSMQCICFLFGFSRTILLQSKNLTVNFNMSACFIVTFSHFIITYTFLCSYSIIYLLKDIKCIDLIFFRLFNDPCFGKYRLPSLLNLLHAFHYIDLIGYSGRLSSV